MPMGRTILPLLMALLASCSLAAPAPDSSSQSSDEISVSADLRLQGHHLLSTGRVRKLLGAGSRMPTSELQARLDSLVITYGDLGHPFIELTAEVDSSRRPPSLSQVHVLEGPQLVMGRLRIDPERPELPDPAQDLPPGTVLRAGRLEDGLYAWLERLNQGGRPLAVLTLTDLSHSLDPAAPESRAILDLRATLADADTVRPGRMLVLGPGITRDLTLQRLARLKPGSPWHPGQVRDARRRLLATGWFSRLEGPGLCRTPQGLAWLLEREELPAYRFDGMLGWLPGRAGAGGRAAFHISLDLANLLGTGRELNVLASRPDGYSQELRLGYQEPFVGGWPVDAGLEVRQRVQDSSWVELDLRLAVGWEAAPGWRIEGGMRLQDLLPDSLNGYRRAGVDASAAREFSVRLEVDRRDDPRNPRRGWQGAFEEAWLKRNFQTYAGLPARGKDLDLHRQQGRLTLWLPLGRRQVLQLGAGAGRFPGHNPGLEDRFRLGGGSGPRGTREESLLANEWAMGQAEWRLLLGPASRAALFWDALLWTGLGESSHLTHGRGAALVLPVRQGQLELQYALTPGDRLREGLLHVRVISRF